MHIERDSKRSITSQYRPFFHRFIEANRMYEVTSPPRSRFRRSPYGVVCILHH